MATITRYVDTDSAGGNGTTDALSGANAAFSTLAAAVSAVGAGNAADDYIFYCSGTAADSTAVTVGFACNSSIVAPHPTRASGKYTGPQTISTSHYRLRVTSGNTPLTLTGKNPVVDGIQVITANVSATYGGIEHGAAVGAVVVRNCRVFREVGQGGGVGVGMSGTGVGGANGYSYDYDNNLIVGYQQEIRHRSPDFWTRTVRIRQNTVYSNGSNNAAILIADQGSAACAYTVVANVAAGTGTTASISRTLGSGSTFTSADNAVSVASSTTDEIALGTEANAWTAPGLLSTSDFTVKNTSSVLYNAVNPTRLTTDIIGFTRDGTNHDVGAFEYRVPLPIITGPSGGAGASTSTANLAENAAQGPAFTTDIALGGGFPTLGGADAALFVITTLSATSWRADPVTSFNFEALPHSNPFVVVFNAAASVSQTCTITVTNANEAPTISTGAAVVTGSTTATVGFNTSTVNRGTCYYRRRTGGSAADASTIVAEGESQGAAASNPQNRAMTGFTAGVAVSIDMVHVVDGDASNVLTVSFMPGDTTAPALTGTIAISGLGVGVATGDGPDATDNDQVDNYEWALSVAGGAYTVYGSPTSTSQVSLTGLANGASHILRQRARDRAGNFSAPLFSSAFIPGQAPAVTTQPTNVSVSAGANPNFTSAASGTPAPTGLWEELIGASWTAISGQSGGTLLLNNVTVADNGRQFRKRWTNALGDIVSNAATLTVTAGQSAPTFTTQPVSQTVNVGGTMTLTAAATGTPTPSLQWQRFVSGSWSNISGATSSTYQLANAQIIDNGGQFRCLASNGVSPDAISNAATLTVNAGGAGTFSALTAIIKVNGIALANTFVYYTWFPSGRAGAVGEAISKTGTTDANGRLPVTHTAAGSGKVWVATRPGSTAAEDYDFMQPLTLV